MKIRIHLLCFLAWFVSSGCAIRWVDEQNREQLIGLVRVVKNDRGLTRRHLAGICLDFASPSFVVGYRELSRIVPLDGDSIESEKWLTSTESASPRREVGWFFCSLQNTTGPRLVDERIAGMVIGNMPAAHHFGFGIFKEHAFEEIDSSIIAAFKAPQGWDHVESITGYLWKSKQMEK